MEFSIFNLLNQLSKMHHFNSILNRSKISVVCCLLLFAFSRITAQEYQHEYYFINPSIEIRFINGKIKQHKITYSYPSLTEQLLTKKVKIPKGDRSCKIEPDFMLPYQEILITLKRKITLAIMVKHDLDIIIDAEKLNDATTLASLLADEGVVFEGEDAGLQKTYNNFLIYRDTITNWLSKALKGSNVPESPGEVKILQEKYSKIGDEFLRINGNSDAWLIADEIKNFNNLLFFYSMFSKKLNDSLWKDVYTHIPLTFSYNANLFYIGLYHHLLALSIQHLQINWDKQLLNERGEKLHEFISRLRIEIDYLSILVLKDYIKSIILIKNIMPPEIKDFLIIQAASDDPKINYFLLQYVYEELDSEAFRQFQKERIDDFVQKKNKDIFKMLY